MELKDLEGIHILSGIEVGVKDVETYWEVQHCNYIKFTLSGVTYLALEDPDDGYRSYMKELQIVDEPCKITLPDIVVMCHHRNGRYPDTIDDVLIFIDAENRKEILAIGTGDVGDYYPVCVLEYRPENMSCNERNNKK